MEEHKTGINFSDLQKIKEALGPTPEQPMSQITVFENRALDDNVIVVSRKIFEALKKDAKPAPPEPPPDRTIYMTKQTTPKPPKRSKGADEEM